MGRFTGWLALIVVLGGLGYVMYEDLKLRREHAAGSTVVSGGAPSPAIDRSAAVDAEPPAPTTVAPEEATMAADPAPAEDLPDEETADASAPPAADDPAAAPAAVDDPAAPPLAMDDPASAPTVATDDAASAPAVEDDEPSPLADADPTVPATTPPGGEAAPDLAEAPAQATEPPPAATADPVPEADMAALPPGDGDAPPTATEADFVTAPPAEEPAPSATAEELLAADEPAVITDAEATPPAAVEADPPAAPVAPGAVTEAPTTTAEAVADAPAADDAPDSVTASAPATEADSASVEEEPAPADAAAAPPAIEESDDTATEIAAAPEGVPGAATGDRAPVSESSARDHSLQATGPEAAPETVIAAVDPGADIEVQAPSVEPAPVPPGIETDVAGTVPTFDVVRVESTGDAVIAGLAPPRAEIAIVSGAQTIATATASATGDWAVALEEPLPPGQYDLAIRATTEEGDTTVSDQRVAVLVPEAPVEEPLVVLNTPDAPSTVFQVPTAPEAADGAMTDPEVPDLPEAPATVVVEAESGAVDAAPPPAAVVETEIEAETVPGMDDSRSSAPAAIAEAEPPAADPDAAAPPEPDMAASPVATEEETSVAAAEPAAVPDGAPTGPAVSEDGTVPDGPGALAQAEPSPDGVEVSAGPEEPPVAAPEPEIAAVSEPEPAPEPAPIEPVVVVTAVEAETTGALFVAGTAITPEVVRVYLDDLLLGEAVPSPSGTWLLEVQRELPAGTYDVRADQVEGGSGTVIARAEVPFEREIDVAILTPVAEAGGPSGAEASGSLAGPTTVIIKRRDNLWRISRQLYGKGIRWSTIYQANKDQIRNPRWIYPGQVFILPEGNVAWEEDGKVAAE